MSKINLISLIKAMKKNLFVFCCCRSVVLVNFFDFLVIYPNLWRKSYVLKPLSVKTLNELNDKNIMTELSREIGEIWSRLFDHRPFLNGEIKLMLKEFEEKRGDREVENLFAILEKLTDIKDSQAEKIRKSGETGLPVLREKLGQALQLSKEVENDYLESHKVYEQRRQELKEKRQKEWDQFIDDMNFKCQRVDNTFEEKEEELRDLYADLNHKLNIAK